MKKIFIVSILFAEIFILGSQVFAQKSAKQKFVFKYKKSDSYRILSTVDEDVYINDILHHKAKILNRISVTVTDVDKQGRGIHDATFMTSENSTNLLKGTFTYGKDYRSIFTRDAFGKFTIEDKYFMPVVRDVPIFPDKEIEPGETWTAEGHEAHDLRENFGIQTPYKVPFNAQYKYVGIEKDKNGKVLHKFDVQYTMRFASDLELIYQHPNIEMPLVTQGYSHQTIFWDAERGCIDHYNETFKIMIQTSHGRLLTFTGTAHAEVEEMQRTADKQNLAAVQKEIKKLGLENVSVTAGEKGLTLSIENIQFEPDSDVLLQSEKFKLNKLAQILNAYPNNDLLVTGHAASVGSPREEQQISELRAQSVANYLIQNNVRDRNHIFTQGMGSSAPIASNSTEEGRVKNRRVEITIMDR